MNRYFSRARSRLSRSPCWSRKISATACAAAHRLMRKHERVQPHSKMRLVRKPSAHPQRVAHFAVVLRRRQANVVDLRIAAPRRATGRRDLELARQIVELRIRGQHLGDLNARCGEASISSSAATPASGQPVTLRTTSPHAPLGESPIASSSSTTSGSDSMLSQ